MFQFIGVAVVAAVLGFFAQLPILGFLILGGVVWLSTSSFLGGAFITVCAVAAVFLGYIPMLFVAIGVSLWTLLAWGFKG